MRRWIVETRVTSRNTYFVEADDEKAAEIATVDASPDATEDENEETTSIVEDFGART